MNAEPQKETIKADVLVIGGGLAGLMAAVEAAKIVNRVVMVTKGRAGRSGNTIMSLNGMAAVLEEGYNQDSVAKHMEDTLKSGQGINNVEVVDAFATGAGEAIQRLVDLGVPFLREENGELLRKGSPGHSCRRFLTVDSSAVKSTRTKGLALSLPLARAAVRAGVRVIDGVMAVDLLKKEGQVTGARGLDRRKEKVWEFHAPGVILACGGVGGLYSLSTNTGDVTGDGYALALRAGAHLRDMEFVQFHPAVSLERPRTVMSTAFFADGAVLRNKSGARYMIKYSPEREMATRDVMARANFSEISAGRGSELGGVYMDFSALGEEVMSTNYKDFHRYLGARKVIEVAPAVHFMMGGVIIDGKGRTNIEGLYAAGETSGGLHGANRLAGNALTEAAVFGMIAGREAAKRAKSFEQVPRGRVTEIVSGEKDRDKNINIGQLRKDLKTIMGEKVALIRKTGDLEAAVNAIEGIKKQLSEAKADNWNQLTELYQLSMMTEVAGSIAEAALKREKSLGAHYREED